MTDSPLEQIDLLDTDYADILARSSHPAFEMQLVRFGIDAAEARIKTNSDRHIGGELSCG